MANTTTIRVPAETRDHLNALARRRGIPAGVVVAELVRDADDRALLADAQESWQHMGESPDLLTSYRAQTRDLDGWDTPLPEY